MDEQHLRAIVREVIAQRLGATHQPPRALALVPTAHVSHGHLRVAPGADHGGACLIEPTTTCNHCGYCLSLGH